MGALAHAEWGWRKEDLKVIYNAFIHSKLHYAAAAWQPWLSDTRIKELDRVQNKAIRIMTGQLKSSPVEALRAEANIESFQTSVERKCLTSMEKARRMPKDHPRRLALELAVPQKNARRSWFKMGTDLTSKLPEGAEERLQFNLYPREPWSSEKLFTLYRTLPGITSREDPVEKKREAAIKRINELAADLIVYTDGSATAGCRAGGAASVATIGEARYPEKIHCIRTKGAAFTSSFEEECQAFKDTMRWLAENAVEYSRVLVCTDSQSLCKALEGHGDAADELRNEIDKCPNELVIQWVPGHSDIPGNELADEEAKQATTVVGEGRAVSFEGITPVIKSIIKDSEIQHARTREVYRCKSSQKEKKVSNRKDEVLLARLRTGHHFGFKSYQHRLNNEEDPTCPRCEESSKNQCLMRPLCLDNVEHWLECDATAEARMREFGRTDVGISILTEDPKGSVALARRTLRGVLWGETPADH